MARTVKPNDIVLIGRHACIVFCNGVGENFKNVRTYDGVLGGMDIPRTTKLPCCKITLKDIADILVAMEKDGYDIWE